MADIMNQLFNDPIAMAGLSVMSGKNLGDALSEAAQLKQRSDYQAMQMQLWHAQAQQAMQQAKLNQQLMSDPSFGIGSPTPQTVMPNMPQQGYDPNQGGQVPPVVPVKESDIPPMPNYLNTPESQNLQRRMVLGAAAGNQGVVDAAKLQLDNLKELAKQSYEANYGSQIAGAKKEAETLGAQRAKNISELPKILDNANQTLEQIQQLKKHEGFSDIVGAKNILGGAVTSYIPFYPEDQSGMKKPIAGTKAADFVARLNQLKGGQFLQAYETLKQGGQITEVEGKKAEAAIARLDAAQSEKEFNNALNEYESIIKTGVQRAKGAVSGKGNEILKSAGKPPASGGIKFLGFE